MNEQERNCIVAVANSFIEQTRDLSRVFTTSNTPAGSERSGFAGVANMNEEMAN